MKKQKSTKRALLMSAMALVLCISMLVGSTFAWFTDSASTAVNTIQSGTLKVDMLDDSDASLVGQSLEWVAADGRAQADILWEPGCTYSMENIYVKNNGNLALKYQLIINGIDGNAELLNVLTWTVTVGGVETELATYEGHLAADEKSNAIVISATMDSAAGNEYQGKTLNGISVTVVATQDTVEADSNDNQYDSAAGYPIVSAPVAITAGAATAPVTVVTDDADISVPADVVNNLPAEVTSISLAHTEPEVDTVNNVISFASVELVDQNGNVIDLANNTAANLTITLPAFGIADGTEVAIMHDGVYIGSATVANGVITYEVPHLCAVDVIDAVAVSDADELAAAFADGKNVMLIDDIDLATQATIAEGTSLTLYLNGHTVTAAAGEICAIKNEGTLVVIGDGEICGGYSALYSTGHLTVEGGNFTATEGWGLLIDNIYGLVDSVAVINGGTFTGVGVYNPTNVTVNGGTFNNGKDPDGWSDQNDNVDFAMLILPVFHDVPNNATVILNGGTFNGDIYVYDDGITETEFVNNGAIINGDILDNA